MVEIFGSFFCEKLVVKLSKGLKSNLDQRTLEQDLMNFAKTEIEKRNINADLYIEVDQEGLIAFLDKVGVAEISSIILNRSEESRVRAVSTLCNRCSSVANVRDDSQKRIINKLIEDLITIVDTWYYSQLSPEDRYMHTKVMGEIESIKISLTEIKDRKPADYQPTNELEPVQLFIRSFIHSNKSELNNNRKNLCLENYFDGRSIKSEKLWGNCILPTIKAFLRDNCCENGNYQFLLDAGYSVGFLLGMCITSKPIFEFAVEQKSNPPKMWSYEKYKIAEMSNRLNAEVTLFGEDDLGIDVFLILCISGDCFTDVNTYIKKAGYKNGKIIHCFVDLPGNASVESGSHATYMADIIKRELDRRTETEKCGHLHIFSRCPNAITVFLGLNAIYFGNCMIYEYDEISRQYFKGVTLQPNVRKEKNING